MDSLYLQTFMIVNFIIYIIIIKYYCFLYNDISKYSPRQIEIGSLNKTSLYNLKKQISLLKLQIEIVKQIELLKDKITHYNEYTKILQTELNI